MVAESEDEDRSDFPSLPPFTPRDLPDGYELRLQEYHNAWSRCLERVQVRVIRYLSLVSR